MCNLMKLDLVLAVISQGSAAGKGLTGLIVCIISKYFLDGHATQMHLICKWW